MSKPTIQLPENYWAKIRHVANARRTGVVLRQFPNIRKSTWHAVCASGRVSERILDELNGFFAGYGPAMDRLAPLVFDSLANGQPVPVSSGAPSEPRSLPISAQQIPSPQTRFDAAIAALNSDRAAWALGALLWDYWDLLTTDLAEALLRLPRVIYAAFRYGSYHDVTQLAVETIQAIKQAPKHLTMPANTRTATLAVLACCLNEGRHYAEARELFISVRGTLAKPDDPEFGWTAGTCRRSETHLNVWHRGSPREIERCFRDAQAADALLGTTTPIIHTRCDVLLEDQPERAWQTIEPEYRRVLAHIVENYNLETGLPKAGKPPLARVHHEVGSIILGLFAAGQLDGALGHDEIEHALKIIGLFEYGRMSYRREPEWNGALHQDLKKDLAGIYAETVTLKLKTPIVWAPPLVELASLLPH